MKGARKYKRAEELEGEQRAAAESTANAVVAAGAGSGKTTVLAARYVHLLESARLDSGERLEPRNILVLTFTRKAAAEMYGRIYGSLAESAALAEERATAAGAASQAIDLAAHLKDCLALFSQAQISTFDSFASRIARSGSARFGVAPDFSVDEVQARKAASELALAFLLEHREEEAMRDLVSALGLEGAQGDVLADLALRRMSISSPPDFAAFHAIQAKRLDRMLAESRQKILAMRDAVLDYSGTKTIETSKRWLDAMAKDPGEDEGDFLSFIALFDGLRKPASNSKDEASQFLSDSVEGIRRAIDAYRNICMTREAHPSRLALYERLDDFRKGWDSSRRAAKILTFRDVAVLALDTLNADDEVRRYYQGLYRYIMIDEFQDDDELQKRILYLLAASPSFELSRRPDASRRDVVRQNSAEPAAADLVPSALAREPQARELVPDKLFFVGDEKQSIYLFRGADVSVFRRLSSELSPLPSGLSLSRNYRSESGVIDMINAIFPDVMASIDPEKGHEDFEARFESLEPRAPTPGVTSRFVYLELPRPEPSDGRGMREPAECEAWEVARIVRDAVESESFMVADRKLGSARPARYEDFAVLLRSTGNQVHFEKYFRLYGVPYGSENACGLFSEAVACDLYYALRLALYPDDRNALAAYLRSPFVGLSDESVARILLAKGGVPALAAASASAELAAAESLLEESERRALLRGAATMAELSGMIDRKPIASCLCHLWFECGYRAALLRDPVASAFEEHFELLHSMAVDADLQGRPLASFVAELELLVGKPDKLEVNLPRESSRGVRIMTVHKSKGLEFPIVIIPQANNVGQDSSSREAWYWEDELGPTFRPPVGRGKKSKNAFFEASKEKRTAMERAELKRLLYVALTRAESHIIVTATEPRSNDTTGKSFRGLLAGPLGLFEPPSPLLHSDGEFQGSTKPPEAIAPLEGFGELTALASGALVGPIPERSDLEYFNLVAGSRKGKPPNIEFSGIPLVERTAASASTSVTAIAERYEEKIALGEVPWTELDIDPALEMPTGLQSDTWGSLVHAALEAALGQGKPASRNLEALQKALEDKLASITAAEAAVRRAKALAKVFLDSELGHRALASEERKVELKIAISLKDDASPNAGPRSIGPHYVRGSIDLAFVEAGKVVVVDYKTDSYMALGAHEVQVAAYERAASDIFNLPAEAWLFYLYGGGRAVRIGSGVGVPGLEEALRLSAD